MAPFSLSSMTHVRARLSVLLLLLALTLGVVLSACGEGGTTTTTKPGAAKATSITVVPSPIGDFTRNFNPFTPTPLYGTQGLVYETLLYINRLDASVKPWLASSYNLAPDAKSVTFTIRDGVKWSDGQPFTADDVVFTLNLLKKNPDADLNNLWQTINTVQSSDAKTVTVTFKKPDSSFLWYLAGQTWIVPKHTWSSVSGSLSKYTNENPVGTGPYALKSFTPQLVDYTKNANYWQPGKPIVQEVRFPAFNAATGTSLALSNGELDWAGLYTPNIDQTYVARDREHYKYWFPPQNVVTLYLNLTKAPFNQLAVRQAISSALDRQQLYKVAETGYEPVASPTGLVLPNHQKFLAPDYANSSFTLDTNKSTQLLESAGFKKGSDGIYADPGGKKLSFNLNVVTGWSDWVTSCQIMSDNLKKVGIKATVNALSYNAYVSALQTGTFDTAISWTSAGPTPYYLLNALLSSKYTAPVGQTAVSNFERWNDPATDKLLSQYTNSTDQATQQQALNGLQKIMVEQLPAIPLMYGAMWYEYNTTHFTGFPDSSNPYAAPAPWEYPDNEVVLLNLKPAA